MTLAASVVIPTHRRPETVTRVVDALAVQDVSPGTFEVVVVCDGLADPSSSLLGHRAYPFPLKLEEQSRQGPSVARNHGISLASGDVIVFLDDDVVPGPGLMRAHLAEHRHDSDLVVIGPLLPPSDWGSPWVRFSGRVLADQYRAIEAGLFEPTPRQFYTGNGSVRKEHLVAAGGFDPGFLRAEDVELAYRLRDHGLRFRFTRSAQVQHLASHSYPAWLDTAYQYGRADVRMGRDGGREDVLRAAGEEFGERNWLTQNLVRLELRVPTVGQLVEHIARPASVLSASLGRHDFATHVLGGAFNLAYWRGFARELGGQHPVRALIEAPVEQSSAIAIGRKGGSALLWLR